MTKPLPTDPRELHAAIVRIGNQAARREQLRNRELGIPNWYSINGRLVSDEHGIDLPPIPGERTDPESQHKP